MEELKAADDRIKTACAQIVRLLRPAVPQDKSYRGIFEVSIRNGKIRVLPRPEAYEEPGWQNMSG